MDAHTRAFISPRITQWQQQQQQQLKRGAPPRHRAERAHAEADYDEETAFENYFNPEAGRWAGPEGPTNA